MFVFLKLLKDVPAKNKNSQESRSRKSSLFFRHISLRCKKSCWSQRQINLKTFQNHERKVEICDKFPWL